MSTLTAKAVVKALSEIADPAAAAKVRRFFRGDDPKTQVMGVPIGKVFPVAARFKDVPLSEVERLLDDRRYEVRMAAMAIMDFKARQRSLTEKDRKALFDLYLRRHDRINNWDLVDRAAPRVIGEYLIDRDRSALDRLASSRQPEARRTAIVATHAFIRRGETADTFRIAGLLAADEDEHVQKAIASWTREAGKKDPSGLVAFLKKNVTVLPRSTLTTASERLTAKQKAAIGGGTDRPPRSVATTSRPRRAPPKRRA